MSLPEPLKLLRQFLKGKTTSAEERRIDSWYNSVDDAEPLSIWTEEHKKDNMVKSMHAYIFDRTGSENGRKARAVTMRRRIFWAAAILTGCMVIPAGYFWRQLQNQGQRQYISITVPLGKVKQLLLPDNSVAWLKSGTTLRYDASFGYRNREVELVEGEAFFEVQKNGNHPFLVKTGRLETKVLGTSFNVQAYRENPHIQVWVDHGCVQVSDSGRVLQVLTADRRLQWDKAQAQFTCDSLKWQQALAWQKGILLLQSASFTELASQLRELYGIRLVTADPSIRLQSYDAKFYIRTPVQAILQTLSEVQHIHFRMKGNEIQFY
ncbi:FecR family protein [Flavitalea flava]